MMRVVLASAVLLCSACEVKLNRGPHLPNAPEDSDRSHGGIEIATKDPPKSRLPLPPPPVQYAEDKYQRARKIDPSAYMLRDDDAVPPEVRRLGPEAVDAYLDLLADADPAKLHDPKQLYLRAYQMRDESPEEAIALFKQVAIATPAGNQWHDKAVHQIEQLTADDPAVEADDAAEAKQIYLRAYQLRDESPENAIELFKQVIALLPAEDEYSEKSMTQLARLGLPLNCMGPRHRGHFVVNTKDLANARATLVNWHYDVLRHSDGAFTIVICD